MNANFPWYEIAEGDELMQGDFLLNFPVIILDNKLFHEPAKHTGHTKSHVEYYHFIILSQSCDLVANKIQKILMAPLWTIDEMAQQQPEFSGKKYSEKIRRGDIVGYHMLNKVEIPGFEMNFLVADFRNIHSFPMELVRQFANNPQKRPRLLPPYREHLSQAFARFMMRVGLPVDIPKFI